MIFRWPDLALAAHQRLARALVLEDALVEDVGDAARSAAPRRACSARKRLLVRRAEADVALQLLEQRLRHAPGYVAGARRVQRRAQVAPVALLGADRLRDEVEVADDVCGEADEVRLGDDTDERAVLVAHREATELPLEHEPRRLREARGPGATEVGLRGHESRDERASRAAGFPDWPERQDVTMGEDADEPASLDDREVSDPAEAGGATPRARGRRTRER